MLTRRQIEEAVAYNRDRRYSEVLWREIQTAVGATVDGIPGPQTTRRVATYQGVHGLIIDGKVGRQTLAQMQLAKQDDAGSTWQHPRFGLLTRGLDLSHHNDRQDDPRDDIDFEAVMAEGRVAWGIFRGSISRKRDRQVVNFWRGAKRVGMPLGLYHFARWGTPIKEQVEVVDKLLAKVGGFGADDLGLVINIEWDKRHDHDMRPVGEQWWGWQPVTRDDARRYIGDMLVLTEQLEELSGRRVMVYTNAYFWRSILYDLDSPEAKALYGRPLWIASYTDNPPAMVGGWPDHGWDVWQYTSQGRVEGARNVRGELRDIDLNWARGSVDDLRRQFTCG